MSEKRKRSRWPWLGIVLLSLLLVYVAGYFTLVEHSSYGVTGEFQYRGFPNATIRNAYRPLTWMECKIRRQHEFLYAVEGMIEVPDYEN